MYNKRKLLIRFQFARLKINWISSVSLAYKIQNELFYWFDQNLVAILSIG